MTRLSLSLRFFLLCLVLIVPIVLVGLRLLTGLNGPMKDAIRFWIVDARGAVRYANQGEPPPLKFGEVELPRAVNEMRGYGPRNTVVAMRLFGDPPHYLVFVRKLSPKIVAAISFRLILPLAAACLVACFALGLFYLRRQARRAEEVLRSLEQGNLGARFSITRMDEIGRLMNRFNEMAERVEYLVRRLREAEASRVQLLSELAHDVRVPLTSLKLAVENLADSGSEDAAIALHEVAYFERLIEDLFLLARLDHPGFQPREGEPVLLAETLEAELANRRLEGKLAWDFQNRLFRETAVRGDGFLLRRLLRNALDNAARFARARVEIRLEHGPEGDVRLVVRDDGPGFSPESLAHFGTRRTTRFLDFSGGNRVSLGLGSVIMRTIAAAHGGSLEAGNWTAPDGAVGGAEIRVRLPGEAAVSGQGKVAAG